MVQLVVGMGNKSYSESGSQFGKGAICRQFWWEVASSLFCASKPLFWLVGGGEIGSGAEGSQFVEGRHLSPIPGEGGLQPIVCCQPARSGEGHFLAVSPGLFLAVSPGLFLAVLAGLLLTVSPGCCWLCRHGCCWLRRLVCSLTVLSGISLVGSGPSYPGCVIKG